MTNSSNKQPSPHKEGPEGRSASREAAYQKAVKESFYGDIVDMVIDRDAPPEK